MNFEEFWDGVNAYASPVIRKNFSGAAPAGFIAGYIQMG